jgi:hypothetical protein
MGQRKNEDSFTRLNRNKFPSGILLQHPTVVFSILALTSSVLGVLLVLLPARYEL